MQIRVYFNENIGSTHDSTHEKPRMSERIAIVGSGVSGLTAAYLLARSNDLVVYEAADYVGGHSHTVPVADGDRTLGVDTGFIVYNERTYPNFCRLLDRLGVATQPSDMTFSFRNDGTSQEYALPELSRLFCRRSNLLRPGFLKMIREIFRFYKEAPRLLAAGEEDPGLDLATYLAREGYGDAFQDDHIFPMAESIWSGSRRELGAFPVLSFLRFFQNHGLLSLKDRPAWRTVSGGSVNYVDKLSAPFRSSIRLNTPVRSVRRGDAGVDVVASDGGVERFDAIVLACHSDQALAMLEAPTDLEREILGSFPYAANDVALHSDATVMPQRRSAWSAWNYHRYDEPDKPVALTYDMNRLQSLPTETPYLVTLNRNDDLDADLVHDRFVYHHPQYNAAGIANQSRHDELNGRNKTYFCGAYWGYGFHEDGVASALRVARHFGETLS